MRKAQCIKVVLYDGTRYRMYTADRAEARAFVQRKKRYGIMIRGVSFLSA